MQEGQKPNKEKGKKKEKQNKCAHIIEGKEQRERPNVQMLDHKKEEKKVRPTPTARKKSKMDSIQDI